MDEGQIGDNKAEVLAYFFLEISELPLAKASSILPSSDIAGSFASVGLSAFAAFAADLRLTRFDPDRKRFGSSRWHL